MAIGITITLVCSFCLSQVVGCLVGIAWTIGSEFV